LGGKFRGRLIPLEERGVEISIHGWVAEGGRAGGKDAHFFLNRRPVRDRILMHALVEGLEEREIAGAGPAAVLWIEIDPMQVDVNVHPAKREVRYAKGGAVHDFVKASVRKAIAACGSWIVDRESRIVMNDSYPSDGVALTMRRFEDRRLGVPLLYKEGIGEVDRDLPLLTSPYKGGGLRPLGQLGLSYILCEHEDGSLALIDQHAAHERLAFDVLRAQFADGRVHVQRLLIPQRVELGAKESAVIIEQLGALENAGFEVEPFGGGSVMVKAVPEILGDAAVAPLFARLADEFEELCSSVALAEAVERIFAVVACHRQVRAGDKLSPDEVSALVADIERHGVATCPHGRPAIVRIERSEIDKWFKRT
ncbi:MAG: hypothetical protein WC956_10975, partial [bacterium]